ncbi:hypothetical protein DM870_26465, partial [Escherichia coli]
SLQKHPQQTVTIPMIGEGARSLNLATSVAIAAFHHQDPAHLF